MSAHEEAAQRYADIGWPVFPCIPGEKVPSVVHGFQDATTDPAQIRKWWTANPGRNVAIATGAPGPDVLDIDHHGEAGNGFAGLNKLARAGLTQGRQAVVSTPSGGLHLYFAGTDQRNGKMPRQHIDYRGRGGYVVAPPSTVNGRPYEVVTHQPSAATFDWAAAKHLLEPEAQRQVQQQRGRQADGGDLERLSAWVSRQEHGNRNDGLHYAACRLAEKGLLDVQGVEQLADAAVRSGLRGGEAEARKTIESAMRSCLGPTQEREREAAG